MALVKKFKTMRGDVKDVKNLSFNARFFDRFFLHDLEWSEWEAIIAELQRNITDEVIDQAMAEFPAEIQGARDQEIGAMLKSRRENLQHIGKRLYQFISREVEIAATDLDDRFEVTTFDDGTVNVKQYLISILKYGPPQI